MHSNILLLVIHDSLSIAGSCADTWIIQFSHLYNVEDGTCVFPFSQGLVYSQEEVICLYKSREEQQIVWDMFKRVQMLDLTNEERAIAGALSVMNCGEC